MGKAMVTFGMVSIPIQVYTTKDTSKSVSFNMLHEKCRTRVKQQLYCAVDDEVVERSDIIKGYQFAKDQYVTFTPDELKALEAESTKAIEIKEFLPVKTVDPVYFSKAYYLSPDRGGQRPYRLLCEAMKKTGRAALAKYAARGKEYLVMLRTVNDVLVMQQMRYADEVKGITDIPVPEAEVSDAELDLAVQLIEQVATEYFEPDKYEDTVSTRIHELIQQKVEGQEVIATAPEAPKAQIIDLMDALKASLSEDAPAEEEEADHEASEDSPAKKVAG